MLRNSLNNLRAAPDYRFWLLMAILATALALRLAHALPQDHLVVYEQAGGDSWWYLEYGRLLVVSQEPTSPPSGPLYLLFVGLPQHLLPPAAAVMAVRVLQAFIGAATCYVVYRLALAVSRDARAGLIAAGALAIAPSFVIEPSLILTETLYMFLLATGLWVYLRGCGLELPANRANPRALALAGGLLGLAALTRAALLLFPLGLALHLLLLFGWRRGLRPAALLLAVYILVVSTWTVYNLARWNRVVIGAQGLAAFLYLGAQDGGWSGPEATDQSLAQQAGVEDNFPTEPDEQQALYREAAARIIMSDPLGYVQKRVQELAAAYLQPHGTLFYGGPSLRELAADWLGSDRTPAGLLRLAQTESFWPKLAVYGFHYAGLLLGLAGLWLTRRAWRAALPLAGFILYTTLVHLALDAIPRYIFPTMPVWWIFAGIALAQLWDAVRRERAPVQAMNGFSSSHHTSAPVKPQRR